LLNSLSTCDFSRYGVVLATQWGMLVCLYTRFGEAGDFEVDFAKIVCRHLSKVSRFVTQIEADFLDEKVHVHTQSWGEVSLGSTYSCPSHEVIRQF
jgi:hypothetical protein